jgi:hypothetical protein
MAFDIQQLTQFAKSAIDEFSDLHKTETFYAFAIDASLCA